MRRIELRLGALTLAGIGVAVAWAACSPDAPTSASRSNPVGNRPNAVQALSTAAAARIEEVGSAVSWAGHLHNAMVREVRLNRSRLAAIRRSDPTAFCSDFAALGSRFRPIVEARSGVRLSEIEFRVAVRAALNHSRDCRGATDMSLFGVMMSVAPQSGDSNVTGEYEAYLTSMQSGVEQTDGTPQQVLPVTASTVASAAGLPWADLYVLATAASITDSSSVYWTAELGGGGGGGGEEPQSLFWSSQGIWRLLVIVISDLLSCSLAVQGLRNLGVTNSIALGAGCLIAAGIGSGIAAM